jgi:hypothetical protein
MSWLMAIALATTTLTARQPQQRRDASATPVTFARDVAPILFASCVTCHRPAGSAPFSLLTYADARARASEIAAATERRFMPPWKPEPGHGEFVGNRRLSDSQIAIFRRWAEAGTPLGNQADLPQPPRWSGRWQLGDPDLVLETEPYTLRASGDDMYRNFVLPIPIEGTRYIRAWEFLPGNTRVLHHSTMQLDTAGGARALDSRDGEPGYEGLIPHSVASPDGFFLDWGPGHTPYVAPDGMAWPIRQGTDLVMMMHLRPSGRPEVVKGTLGLYFSDRPPTRQPALVRLTRQNLDIPAGRTRHVVVDTVTLPVPVEVYSVQPHAHYLAREVKGFANLPDGTQRALLYIRDWDFDWQGVYRYMTPIRLPAGTEIRMEILFDNSTGNARNPHSPPRRVTYGQRTNDEMAELWFQVVAGSDADRATLVATMQDHVYREEIVGHEKMLESDPANTALHDGVALLHAAVGNMAGAAHHFSESLKTNPASPSAHYNVGMTLVLRNRHDEAEAYFTRALTLDPSYAPALDGMGVVRERQGRDGEALSYYRSAVRLSPANAEAQAHLTALERRLARAPR